MSIKATIKDLFTVGLANGGQEISKEEKIKLMDAALDDSMGRPKGLLVTANFSNPGKRINNRVYAPIAQRDSMGLWTAPAPLPLLKNHDTESEPLGRVVSVEMVDYKDRISNYFRDGKEMNSFMSDMYSDDPKKIQAAMNRRGLLMNAQWPGVAELRGKVRVSDKEAIEKFLDSRYLTLSASAMASQIMCGTCGTNWAMGDMCEHHPGDAVEDGPGYNTIIAMDYLPREISVVNIPGNKTSFVQSMQMIDHEGNDILENMKKANQKRWSFPIDLRDGSSVEVFNDYHGGEPCKECGKSECECEAKDEAPEKEFDHSMTISEPQMRELHESGKVDIEQSGEKGEKMIIRVMYNSPEARDSEEAEDVIEDAAKKFKVPAGARGNAKQVLKWKEEHGSAVKGMTPVGWARARQLASQAEIPLSTVKRMAAFNRHRKNAAIDPKFKDEPWRDRGYVAWLGWGGNTGIDWAIKISQANDSATEDFDGDSWYSDLIEDKKGKGAKTPAKPSERIKGSKKNKEGSAKKGSSSIVVGAAAEKSLKEKVEKHNEKHGAKKGKKVSLGMLKAVWRRGAGAFSSTHRPNMSRAGWAMARVNAFLKLVASGSPENKKYNTDNDLLPAGHPKKSNSDMQQAESQECTNTNDSEDTMSEEMLDLIDSILTQKVLSSKESYTALSTMDDSCFLFEGRKIPVADKKQVEMALEVVSKINLSDELNNLLTERLQAKMDSLQDSETKEMEELISKFVGLGLNDSEARAAAVLHLVKTADLSDEERTALFAPEKVEVKDEKLEQDYAQLAKDHAQLKEELESLKASNEKADEAVEVKDADENVEESTKKTATEVVEDAATEEAEVKTEAVETEVAELKDSDEQETKVVDTVEKIDNPSASVTDAVNNQSEVAELTDYQRQKVNRYKHIRDSQSEEAAGAFISMLKRSNRLPGDFDVTPHLK